jgi:putative FmdB family regulatory protein
MWRLTLRGGKENAMSRYEVPCEKCQEPVELIMTISERETAKPTCPTCKGTNVTPQFSGFMAQTGKKS